MTKRSRDMVEMIRIVRDFGGSISEILPGKRHVRVRVVTHAGNHLVLTLAKSKSDPKKLRDWIRQDFNKADAKADKE